MPKGFKSKYNSANVKFRHLKLADPGKSEIKPTFFNDETPGLYQNCRPS